jgi:hypothetical protein
MTFDRTSAYLASGNIPKEQSVKVIAILGLAVLGFLTAGPAAAASGYVIGYDETKSLFVNQTMLSYDRAHGTQVEYLAKNSRTYLLYPGNQTIVQGSWKLIRTDNPNVFDMCFKYPANTFNPVTGQSGGNWDCKAAGFYMTGVAEHKDGDVLGLSRSAEVPFVLARKKASLASLIRKLPR